MNQPKPGHRQTALTDLTLHPQNPRHGDIGAIVESIEQNGWIGSLVAQCSTGHVLAGNHRMQAAAHCGFKKLPTHWIDCDDAAALRILLSDNRTSDLATNDDAVLAEILAGLAATEAGFTGTGYDGDDLDAILAGLDEPLGLPGLNPYTHKIVAPIYEPVEHASPLVSELMDTTKTDELSEELLHADIPDEVAGFLVAAAERHTVFHFARIAEFYAHADATTQALMERNGLVIIDYEQAVENGFVQMSQTLARLFGETQ